MLCLTLFIGNCPWIANIQIYLEQFSLLFSVHRVWDVLLFDGNCLMLFQTALALMELYGTGKFTFVFDTHFFFTSSVILYFGVF